MDPRRRRLLLALLLALALVVKGVHVLTLSDVFFYGEELEKGAAAKGMLDGLGIPHHQLAYHYYEGGGFVVSHLKAVAFLLVGQSLLANKLAALVFVLLVLAAGFAFVRRAFGEAAAVWFGLLYVFSPATFQKLSLLSLGIHFEATLFLLLAFLLTTRIAFERERRLIDYALLGLVVGFGTYFSYQTVLVGAWCALLLLIRAPRRTLGLGGLAGLGGTLVGLVPFFAMVYLVGDAMFDIHGTTREGQPPSSVKLRAFLRDIYLYGALGSWVGALIWPLATLLAAGAVLIDRREEGKPEQRRFLFVALFLPFWFAVYMASPFVQDKVPHYFYLMRLAPVWIVALVLIAAALGQRFGPRARPGRGLGLACGGLLVAVGLANAVEIAREGRPGELAACWDELNHQKGYVYRTYFDKIVHHLEGDQAAKLEVLLRFDEPDPPFLAAAAASSVLGDPVPDLAGAFARAEARIGAVDPALAEPMWRGLGRLLVAGSGWSAELALERVEGLQDDQLRELLAEAIGRFGSGGHPAEEALLAQLGMSAASPLAEPFARGVGHQLFRRHRLRPAAAEAFLSRLGPRAPAVRQGYEHARDLHRLP